MAEENEDGQEKSEDASEERRDEFRKRGDVAYSREISSVFGLVGSLLALSYFFVDFYIELTKLLKHYFTSISFFRVSHKNFSISLWDAWKCFLIVTLPLAIATSFSSGMATLVQTRFNVAFKKISPNFAKMNPLKGIAKMFSAQALLELFKSLGKMTAVGSVSYLILYSDWDHLPSLIYISTAKNWLYWASISKILFWSVASILLLIAGVDYFYNFYELEKKMRMTKQEVKEEFKQREVDPHIKNRLRRMQRDLASKKTLQATKEATVIITNPTHFAIALKYNLGMKVPVVIAKGVDLIALDMRKIAKEKDIPIVENKPLARALYKDADIDMEIPQTFYAAISEVIRYVFKIKGVKLNRGGK